MKSKRKRILVISTIIIIILTISREVGLIDLNFYTTQTSSINKGKWNSNSVKIKTKTTVKSTNTSTNETTTTTLYNRENSFKQTEDSPIGVIVKYDSKIVGDIEAKNPTCIDISNSELGIVWLPFFKYSNYEISANYKFKNIINTDSTSIKNNINGEVNLSGNYKIVGFCSYRKAKDLILEKAMNEIYEDIVKNWKKNNKV